MSHIIIIKLTAKIDPSEVFYFLSKKNNFCFLDSSLSGNKYANFSYICFEPDYLIKSSGGINENINFLNSKSFKSESHPLEFLNEEINKNFYFNFLKNNTKPSCTFYDLPAGSFEKNAYIENKDYPAFKGGFIGYLSYDLKKYIEILPDKVKDDLNLPFYNLLYFSKVFSYSHKENCWYYIENRSSKYGAPSLKETMSIAKKADAFLLKQRNSMPDNGIIKKIVDKYLKLKFNSIKLDSNISKKEYLSSVLAAKKYIHEGDIYQVNFTHRFSVRLPLNAADFYYILRKTNPAPFCAFIDFGSFKIASTSPERLILIKKDYIETRPIKGTRPRGKNKAQDLDLKKELKDSIKDRAELNMIVDLERNDLGKFCKYGSIKVKQHAVVEKYAKVFHTVSTVSGRIKKGTNFSEIVKAVFPGGSITGAPKIRAMQIIDELEKNSRSIYTGSIGYISVDGNVDLNIAIRTLIIKDEMFFYNTGGGIVEDSECDEEYEETIQKGEALEKALKFFEYENLRKTVI